MANSYAPFNATPRSILNTKFTDQNHFIVEKRECETKTSGGGKKNVFDFPLAFLFPKCNKDRIGRVNNPLIDLLSKIYDW